MDFSKAFDTVPHERLLGRFLKRGITGNVLNWIRAWLSDRRQRVCIREGRSEWMAVESGVPQGSVQGPLLFIMFVNDIDVDIFSWLLKFADDLEIFACAWDGRTEEGCGQIWIGWINGQTLGR